jgi:hypothetical protein
MENEGDADKPNDNSRPQFVIDRDFEPKPQNERDEEGGGIVQ